MALAGSKPYWVVFVTEYGAEVSRVDNFQAERDLMQDVGGRSIGRTYKERAAERQAEAHNKRFLKGEYRHVNPPSGFIPCKAVKITRNRGKVEVRIRK